MRLTALPTLLTPLLTLSTLVACVAPVGGDDSDRNPRPPTGSCDMDDLEEVTMNKTIRTADDFEDDEFPSGCWDLRGTLRIESPNITSLEKLGKLAAVTNLELVNTKLTRLDLVEPLTVYAELDIRDNSSLATLDNLIIEQDRAVGITIEDNGALTSLAGLDDVTKVEGVLEDDGSLKSPGWLVIRNNAKLASLGLSQLTEVTGRVEIVGNAALASLDSLADLKTISGDLTIADNAKLASIKLPRFATVTGPTRISNNAALTAIDVANLEALKRLEISDNPALTTFAGFRARQIGSDLVIRNNAKLTSLGSMFSLDSVLGPVTIDNNAALTNLGAFTLTFRNVTGPMTISNNPQLVDLGSVSHMNGIAGAVSITNNAKLTYCKALEIDHCVPQTGVVSIVGNLNTTTNCDCWCD